MSNHIVANTASNRKATCPIRVSARTTATFSIPQNRVNTTQTTTGVIWD
ncbi:hypothetical protein TGAMA5MH_05025 [Trichoderma gamsii]|uniref:Uncharacterized protein n=1 Tax=Trichoderma gamsii TaxID=398673 RepID=A0A2K0TC37_9HYPO|nr:hypothetical protein TGAMA5MH_05025 [Trichoderma gamsii]